MSVGRRMMLQTPNPVESELELDWHWGGKWPGRRTEDGEQKEGHYRCHGLSGEEEMDSC